MDIAFFDLYDTIAPAGPFSCDIDTNDWGYDCSSVIAQADYLNALTGPSMPMVSLILLECKIETMASQLNAVYTYTIGESKLSIDIPELFDSSTCLPCS